MKITLSLITFLLVISNQIVLSQSKKNISDLLKSKFENFEYESVLSITDSILKSNSDLAKNDSIQIFYYRSLSAFHIWDINLSEDNFKTLLKLDKNFILDSTEVSPKIVNFFNQIKKRESENSIQLNNKEKENDLTTSFQEIYKKKYSDYREALWKNFLIPGWGNLSLKEKTKGYIITSSFSISLISSMYFYFNTKAKEKEYLNEVTPEKIAEKYNSYNSSYKIRNLSFIALGLIYIYSQIDLLTRNPFQENIIISNLNVGSLQNQIQFTLTFPIK